MNRKASQNGFVVISVAVMVGKRYSGSAQVAFAVIGSADMSGPRYDGRPELLRLHRLRLHDGTEIKVAAHNGFAVSGSADMVGQKQIESSKVASP